MNPENRIREFREEVLGYTQDGLAEELGLTKYQIRNAEGSGKSGEGGKMAIRVAHLMGMVYHVGWRWLLGEIPGPPVTPSGQPYPSNEDREKWESRAGFQKEDRELRADWVLIQYARFIRAILLKNAGTKRFEAAMASIGLALNEVAAVFGCDEDVMKIDSISEVLGLKKQKGNLCLSIAEHARNNVKEQKLILLKSMKAQFQEWLRGEIRVGDEEKPIILNGGAFRKMINEGLLNGGEQIVEYNIDTKQARKVERKNPSEPNSIRAIVWTPPEEELHGCIMSFNLKLVFTPQIKPFAQVGFDKEMTDKDKEWAIQSKQFRELNSGVRMRYTPEGGAEEKEINCPPGWLNSLDPSCGNQMPVFVHFIKGEKCNVRILTRFFPLDKDAQAAVMIEELPLSQEPPPAKPSPALPSTAPGSVDAPQRENSPAKKPRGKRRAQ